MACPAIITGDRFVSRLIEHIDCQSRYLGSYGYEALGQPGTLDWRFANATVAPVPRDLLDAPPGRIVPVAGEALVAMLRRFGMLR